MPGKSTHLQVIPQQNTQKQQTCGYRHTTKNSGNCYWHRTGAYFSPSNNFANLGFFAKISVPAGSIIPSYVSSYNLRVVALRYQIHSNTNCVKHLMFQYYKIS